MKIFESTGFPKSYPQVIHKLGITFCIAIDLFCKMEYNAEKKLHCICGILRTTARRKEQ